jgi:dipeptidyl aminopeptidase/acylaminoacyl peptidase
LWQRPDRYIEESSVLRADRVTTPLLMMHNKGDEAVPLQQGVEFFTALRRLGKKVWMLQYDKGGHGVTDPDDAKDYTIRLTQFFDHYLKGAPAPKWMTEGVPARLKGIESGLELDASGREP